MYDWGDPRELPYVPVADLEAYTWQQVCQALLDPDRLAEGMAASRTQHDQANIQRFERIAIVDAEIREKRTRLDKIAERLLDAERGGELEALWKRQAKETDETLQRLKTERTALEAMRAEGLSAEDAESLEAFAAEVREGFESFTPADVRHVFELLQLRGTVRLDPNGVKLGRAHTYRIDWEARVSIPNSEHGTLIQCFSKSLLVMLAKRRCRAGILPGTTS